MEEDTTQQYGELQKQNKVVRENQVFHTETYQVFVFPSKCSAVEKI